jgi:energy-coupling factor transporter transmembrane protein EcfT
MNIKKLFTEKLKWIDYIVSVIFLAILCYTVFCKPKNSDYLHLGNISIIKRVDTLSTSNYNNTEHNLVLSNLLQQKLQDQQNGIKAIQGYQVEVRNFYTLILIAILSFLFNKQKKNGSSIYIILLGFIFIIIMYAIDVHSNDLQSRIRYSQNMTNAAVDSLVSSYPYSHSWYKIDYDSLSNKMNAVAALDNRFFRKIKEGLQPGPLQIVFYFFPWIVLYFMNRKNLYEFLIERKKSIDMH